MVKDASWITAILLCPEPEPEDSAWQSDHGWVYKYHTSSLFIFCLAPDPSVQNGTRIDVPEEKCLPS